MVHEKVIEDNLVVPELTKIIHDYWDKIVSAKINTSDSCSIRQALFEATKNQNFSKTISEILSGKNPDNKNIPRKMKEALANAMTEEFLQAKHLLSEWTMLLFYWGIFDLFKKNIKEKLITDKELCIQAIREVSVYLFEHPEHLIHEEEKKLFLSSVEHWKKETDIQEFWAYGTREWYPYDAEAFLIPKLLLPEDPKIFLEIASHMTFPMFLYELIASVRRRNEIKYLLTLLKEAPVSVDEVTDMQWNQSWVAPVILDEVFQKIVGDYPANQNINEEEKKNIQSIFFEVGNILQSRSDGLFLAWNYIKYLLSSENRNKIISSICLEEFGRSLHDKAKERYQSPDSFRELFLEDVSFIRKSFKETGILKKKQDKSAYMELLTWIQFFFDEDEYLKTGLFYLETSLMFSDDRINTYDVSLNQCHYDIAAMYFTKFCEDTVKGWEGTWLLFNMAKYRSTFKFYDTNSIELRKKLDFLLLVALAILEHLYSSEKWEMMKGLWKKLWKIMEARIQNKSSKDEKFNVDYVQVLYCWKAMQIRKMYEKTDKCNERWERELMKVVTLLLKSYPEMYSLVINCLKRNGHIKAC